MKHLALLTALTLAATPVAAGGPVLIEDRYDTESEAAPKLTAGEKLAIAAGLLLVIALASGGGSGSVCNGDEQPTPEPGC